MFIHNINPILIPISESFAIRYYGLIYALAFILVYFLFKRFAAKGSIKNLKPELVDSLTLYVVLGVIIGARLGEVLFYNLPYYLSKPLHIFMVWQGGMSFHGGLIGVAIVLYLFCKKHKINLLEIADILVIPAAFALFLGRIANFINHELIGVPTKNTPWYCIDYSNYGIEGCRHPSQIYESIKNLFIGLILLIEYNYFQKFKKKYKPGIVFFSFITLYGLLRFLVNFYRADHPIIISLGISTGQILSLLMFFVGIFFLIKNYLLKKDDKKVK